jgi:hypothetical protein
MCSLVMASSGLRPNGTAQILLDWDPLVELEEATCRARAVETMERRDIEHLARGRRVASMAVVLILMSVNNGTIDTGVVES